VNVMNLATWNSLRPDQQTLVKDLSMQAQKMIRDATESVDNIAQARGLLEPLGMKVNEANLPAFKKVAQEKVWPAYQKQYAAMWEQITATAA